jgi:RsiW-degrading membrane proteinase PrsW (M82 family)
VFLLLIRFLDLYEREPISLVFVMFFWGAIGAAILASLGNELLEGSLPVDVDVVYGPMLSAPVVEELAKGLALVAAFAFSRWASRRFGVFEFDGPTDGIVYGAAIGIGFAFSEDLYYFFREAQLGGDLGDALQVYIDRRDFFGPAMLRHAIWTATFGAGLGLATWSRGSLGRYGFPLLGLLLAMLMHAVNNGLVPVLLALKYGFETTYEYLAVGVPVSLADRMDATAASATSTLKVLSWIYVAVFFAAITAWLAYQRGVIARQLADERKKGLISGQEEALAPRFIRRSRYYLDLIRTGRMPDMRTAARMYGDLVDLAFAKQRWGGRSAGRRELARRRARIAYLRSELVRSESQAKMT